MIINYLSKRKHTLFAYAIVTTLFWQCFDPTITPDMVKNVTVESIYQGLNSAASDINGVSSDDTLVFSFDAPSKYLSGKALSKNDIQSFRFTLWPETDGFSYFNPSFTKDMPVSDFSNNGQRYSFKLTVTQLSLELPLIRSSKDISKYYFIFQTLTDNQDELAGKIDESIKGSLTLDPDFYPDRTIHSIYNVNTKSERLRRGDTTIILGYNIRKGIKSIGFNSKLNRTSVIYKSELLDTGTVAGSNDPRINSYIKFILPTKISVPESYIELEYYVGAPVKRTVRNIDGAYKKDSVNVILLEGRGTRTDKYFSLDENGIPQGTNAFLQNPMPKNIGIIEEADGAALVEGFPKLYPTPKVTIRAVYHLDDTLRIPPYFKYNGNRQYNLTATGMGDVWLKNLGKYCFDINNGIDSIKDLCANQTFHPLVGVPEEVKDYHAFFDTLGNASAAFKLTLYKEAKRGRVYFFNAKDYEPRYLVLRDLKTQQILKLPFDYIDKNTQSNFINTNTHYLTDLWTPSAPNIEKPINRNKATMIKDDSYSKNGVILPKDTYLTLNIPLLSDYELLNFEYTYNGVKKIYFLPKNSNGTPVYGVRPILKAPTINIKDEYAFSPIDKKLDFDTASSKMAYPVDTIAFVDFNTQPFMLLLDSFKIDAKYTYYNRVKPFSASLPPNSSYFDYSSGGGSSGYITFTYPNALLHRPVFKFYFSDGNGKNVRTYTKVSRAYSTDSIRKTNEFLEIPNKLTGFDFHTSSTRNMVENNDKFYVNFFGDTVDVIEKNPYDSLLSIPFKYFDKDYMKENAKYYQVNFYMGHMDTIKAGGKMELMYSRNMEDKYGLKLLKGDILKHKIYNLEYFQKLKEENELAVSINAPNIFDSLRIKAEVFSYTNELIAVDSMDFYYDADAGDMIFVRELYQLARTKNGQLLSDWDWDKDGTIDPKGTYKKAPNNWDLDANYVSENWKWLTVESKRIKRIDMSKMKLVGEIPKSIKKLTKLKYIDFSGNDLEKFPFEELGNVTSLDTLILDSNAITSKLASRLFEHTDIKYIQLRSNKIPDTIPNTIGRQKNLEFLDLGENLIRAMSDSIWHLPKLSKLLLDSNLIDTITEDIKYALNYDTITLDRNKIHGNIPEGAMSDLANIKFFTLYGNDSLYGRIPRGMCSSREKYTDFELQRRDNNINDDETFVIDCDTIPQVGIDFITNISETAPSNYTIGDYNTSTEVLKYSIRQAMFSFTDMMGYNTSIRALVKGQLDDINNVGFMRSGFDREVNQSVLAASPGAAGQLVANKDWINANSFKIFKSTAVGDRFSDQKFNRTIKTQGGFAFQDMTNIHNSGKNSKDLAIATNGFNKNQPSQLKVSNEHMGLNKTATGKYRLIAPSTDFYDKNGLEFYFYTSLVPNLLQSKAGVDLPYTNSSPLEWQGKDPKLMPDLSQWRYMSNFANDLIALDLQGQNILSPIPDSINTLKNLEKLILAENFFHDTIPDSLSGLTNLKYFAISNSLEKMKYTPLVPENASPSVQPRSTDTTVSVALRGKLSNKVCSNRTRYSNFYLGYYKYDQLSDCHSTGRAPSIDGMNNLNFDQVQAIQSFVHMSGINIFQNTKTYTGIKSISQLFSKTQGLAGNLVPHLYFEQEEIDRDIVGSYRYYPRSIFHITRKDIDTIDLSKMAFSNYYDNKFNNTRTEYSDNNFSNDNDWELGKWNHMKNLTSLKKLFINDIDNNTQSNNTAYPGTNWKIGKVTSLPNEFFVNMPNSLEYLDLSDNLVEGKVGDSLGGRVNIRRIDLSFNQIEISFDIKDSLPDLEALRLNDNKINPDKQITYIGKKVGVPKNLKYSRKLDTLFLHNNQDLFSDNPLPPALQPSGATRNLLPKYMDSLPPLKYMTMYGVIAFGDLANAVCADREYYNQFVLQKLDGLINDDLNRVRDCDTLAMQSKSKTLNINFRDKQALISFADAMRFDFGNTAFPRSHDVDMISSDENPAWSARAKVNDADYHYGLINYMSIITNGVPYSDSIILATIRIDTVNINKGSTKVRSLYYSMDDNFDYSRDTSKTKTVLPGTLNATLFDFAASTSSFPYNLAGLSQKYENNWGFINSLDSIERLTVSNILKMNADGTPQIKNVNYPYRNRYAVVERALSFKVTYNFEMKKLNYLDISNNNISHLHSGVTGIQKGLYLRDYLPNLYMLDFSDNPELIYISYYLNNIHTVDMSYSGSIRKGEHFSRSNVPISKVNELYMSNVNITYSQPSGAEGDIIDLLNLDKSTTGLRLNGNNFSAKQLADLMNKMATGREANELLYLDVSYQGKQNISLPNNSAVGINDINFLRYFDVSGVTTGSFNRLPFIDLDSYEGNNLRYYNAEDLDGATDQIKNIPIQSAGVMCKNLDLRIKNPSVSFSFEKYVATPCIDE